ARGLGHRRRRTAHRTPALAQERPASPRRRLLLRHQRYQRSRHPGGAAPGRAGGRQRTGQPGPGSPALRGVRPDSGGGARPRRPAAFIEADPGLDRAGIASPLGTARTAFDERAVVVAGNRDELVAGLNALAGGQDAPDVRTGRSAGPGKLAFLFTGQGSQRPGMGRQLYQTYPVYAQAFDAACAELDRHLARHVTHPVRDVVFAAEDTGLLHQTVFTQPALFAVETALFRLFESWGVRPDFLTGHSVGEPAAAHAAGVLTLPDAAALVAARARLMQALPPGRALL